jgi:hypothetical protein
MYLLAFSRFDALNQAFSGDFWTVLMLWDALGCRSIKNLTYTAKI